VEAAVINLEAVVVVTLEVEVDTKAVEVRTLSSLSFLIRQ
jgi:hypothetical protein